MMARAVVGVCLSEEGGRIKIRLTGIIPNGSPHPVRWILIHPAASSDQPLSAIHSANTASGTVPPMAAVIVGPNCISARAKWSLYPTSPRPEG